jgi:hypothetical protein
MKHRRPSIGAIVAQQTQLLLGGGIKLLLEEHREELLQLMKQAQEERGAALLHDICRRFPMAAGVVNLAMGGSALDAIASIEKFDPKLAAAMRANIGSFRKLQDAYNRGEN